MNSFTSGRIYLYEAADDGMFSLNKKHLPSRELLDSRVLDICGTKGTFRDVFFYWESRCSSKTAEFNAIGTSPSLNRQTANEALCKVLTFCCSQLAEILMIYSLAQPAVLLKLIVFRV